MNNIQEPQTRVSQEWQTANLNGKIRTRSLPVTPSMRLFMENGRSIDISIRASIFGEVGRIVINSDSVLAVNKMKHVYCSEAISPVTYYYPDLIEDIQQFLLGNEVRFVTDAFEYDYSYDPEGRPLKLDAGISLMDKDWKLLVNYTRPGDDTDMDLTLSEGEREKFKATLDFDAPQYDVQSKEAFQLPSKYTRVGIKEFVNSLKF